MKPDVLYDYGWMAWFWRVLMAVGVVSGLVYAVIGAASPPNWWLTLFGVLFAAFPLVFGHCIVTMIKLDEGSEQLICSTLSLTVRSVPRQQLRIWSASRYYTDPHGMRSRFYAPRVWFKVPQALPLYLDLLGSIPDRGALRAVLPQIAHLIQDPPKVLPPTTTRRRRRKP